ncbi:MAG: helix-turn-helix transcriptional regulator [Polyangiaceae bacterium]
MPPRNRSTADHGRSEVRERPSLQKPINLALQKLGARLREVRERLGLTQEAAAELSGLHAKHLGVIEGGKTNVTVASLVALAVAYRVPLTELFAKQDARRGDTAKKFAPRRPARAR